ncbi:MAG: hypothetical protein L3K52_17815 [Candidatus Thiothrix sulfatifontis]|nr:MAG: hypothetical protein L3K52_17815 [Candidatus Thiothrix sulfatifontis]
MGFADVDLQVAAEALGDGAFPSLRAGGGLQRNPQQVCIWLWIPLPVVVG